MKSESVGRPVTHTNDRLLRALHSSRMFLPALAIIAGIILIINGDSIVAELAGIALVVGGVWDHR